ncbi:MAG: hypothetical protein ACI9UK_000418, partial [Candidatus Krumholzibacteriia bacterium]
GLVLFSDEVEKFIPPGKGKSHVLRLIRELLTFTPEGHGTDLNAPMRLLGSVLKRKATVFVVSDFWCEDFSTSLSILGRRHDVVAVRVRDPRETSLPQVGLVNWVDAETGETVLIDTSSPETSRQLALRVAAADQRLSRLLASRGVDVVDIDVTESYVDPLRSFFLAREGRSGRKGRR